MGARSGGGGSIMGFGISKSTAALNKQLTPKSFKGPNQVMSFQGKYGGTVTPSGGYKNSQFGVHIEGKGFLKFKGDSGPMAFKTKAQAAQFAKTGLLSYKDVEFVKPIKQ